MGRGQSRSRTIAANRKVGGAKRSMRAAVKRAQKKLENRVDPVARQKERFNKIRREDFQNRVGNKRKFADKGDDMFTDSRRNRRKFDSDGYRDARDRRRVEGDTEALYRRDETAPRYDPSGKPTGVKDFGRLNQLNGPSRSPKYRNQYKDIDGNRKGTDRFDRNPGDVERRRDANSRRVGGERARDYADRSRAEASRSRRNERRRQRYAERKAFGPSAPKSTLRQRPGMNRDAVDNLLRNFFPTWEVYGWRLR